MTVVLAGVAAIYVALLILLFVAQRSILYVPNTQAPSLAEVGAEGVMEAVETRSADGLHLLAEALSLGVEGDDHRVQRASRSHRA